METHTSSPAIEVTGLVKKFGSLRALDSLNLLVETGSVHGFLGPNGAGKSTTLRVLLGMYRRDAGQVRVLGHDPAKSASRVTRRVAYVPGDVALWPSLTGAQTLDAFAALRGARDRKREKELIEAFAVDPSKPVRTYSTGNRQKIVLIAALSASSRLLLLDEPTSGLDPLQEQVFQQAVRHAAAEGRSILLSSHILSEVDQLCETVTIIRDGRTVESGLLTEMRHLRSSRITLRLPDGARSRLPRSLPPPSPGPDGLLTFSVPTPQTPQVLLDLLQAGATDVTCTKASLEELFLRHYEVQAR